MDAFLFLQGGVVTTRLIPQSSGQYNYLPGSACCTGNQFSSLQQVKNVPFQPA
jgi:hypothetical protein